MTTNDTGTGMLTALVSGVKGQVGSLVSGNHNEKAALLLWPGNKSNKASTDLINGGDGNGLF